MTDKKKSACAECNRVKHKKYRDHHPDYRKKHHNRIMKYRYGITSEEYREMVSSQNNSCQICKSEFSSSRDAHIDHSHETKMVRGILCQRCNQALGLFQEDPVRIRNAIDYLRKHNG